MLLVLVLLGLLVLVSLLVSETEAPHLSLLPPVKTSSCDPQAQVVSPQSNWRKIECYSKIIEHRSLKIAHFFRVFKLGDDLA